MARKARSAAEKKTDLALAHRLARIRKERGFTQVEFAEKIGIIQGLVSDYEREKLRSHPDTEAILWRELAGSALGVAFRRQAPIDRYIVDFLAAARTLVVEADGGIHSVRRSRDARRDRVLARLRYRVVRFESELVRRNLAQAVTQVQEVKLQIATIDSHARVDL